MDRHPKNPKHPVHGLQEPYLSQIEQDFGRSFPEIGSWMPPSKLQANLQSDERGEVQLPAYAKSMSPRATVKPDTTSNSSNRISYDVFSRQNPISHIPPFHSVVEANLLPVQSPPQKVPHPQYHQQQSWHDQSSPYFDGTGSTTFQQAQIPAVIPQESIDVRYEFVRFMHPLHGTSVPHVWSTQQSSRGHSYGSINIKHNSLIIMGDVGKHHHPRSHEYKNVDADGSCTVVAGDMTEEGYEAVQRHRADRSTTDSIPTQSRRGS